MHLKRLFLLITVFGFLSCSHDDDNSKPINTVGLDQRPNNLTCIAPDVLATLPTNISLVDAFPSLPGLGAIVNLLQAPGDSSVFYAPLQDGRVLRFANESDVNSFEVFLDISDRVTFSGEMGLLGMAFHPDYADTGEIFLSYVGNDNGRKSKISRFTFNTETNVWDEENVLTVVQPAGNHNGGHIAFDANDHLFIGFGDGGGSGDTYGHGQRTSSVLGAMLRLDVVNARPYGIPSDNPFQGNALCNVDDPERTEPCPEIFAWGLRNPWRWSFDRNTNELWAGDVGQERREEVDSIELGNNYGWNIMEGFSCYPPSNNSCDQTGLSLPEYDYSRNSGTRAVVGGYKYRGSDPQLSVILNDTYLYSDTYLKTIWGLKYVQGQYQNTELATVNLQYLYSFAEDLAGELYVIGPQNSSGINIFKIAADVPPNNGEQPAAVLSETGCVNPNDPTQPASGVIPYDIIAPLWSDNAEKKRFFAIPNNTTITVDADGDFEFPIGSVLMKNFKLNGKLIETRLLMRHLDAWSGYSYEWQYDQLGNPTDAQLLTTSHSKSIEGQNWFYPSPTDCLACHTNGSKVALGPETSQLNKEFYYATTGRSYNQLQTYEHIGLLSQPLTANQKRNLLSALDNDAVSLQMRVKSYLHSNCAHCHQPGEVNTTEIDLRFDTPLEMMNICDEPPLRGDLGITDILIVDANGTYDEPNSVLVERMMSMDTGLRMPPLATEIVHSEAVDAIKRWIDEELAACPPAM